MYISVFMYKHLFSVKHFLNMFYYKMVLQYIAKDFVIIMGYYEYWGTVLYLKDLTAWECESFMFTWNVTDCNAA